MLGRICALRYDLSGWIRPLDSQAETCVPFDAVEGAALWGPPARPRINQEVVFDLRSPLRNRRATNLRGYCAAGSSDTGGASPAVGSSEAARGTQRAPPVAALHSRAAQPRARSSPTGSLAEASPPPRCGAAAVPAAEGCCRASRGSRWDSADVRASRGDEQPLRGIAPDVYASEHGRGGAAASAAPRQVETLRGVRRAQSRRLAELGTPQRAVRDELVAAALAAAREALRRGDPEAMVNAVVDIIALLSPPRRPGVRAQGLPMPEGAVDRLRAARQRALRRALLRLLSGQGGPDLSDAGTRSLLRCPLAHLARMLRGVQLGSMRSAVQWTRIADVFAAASWSLASGADGLLARARSRSTRPLHRTRAGAVFEPNWKLKQLGTVSCRPGSAVTLRCKICGHSIISEYFFLSPRTGKTRVLVPRGNGNESCAGRYSATDGTPCIVDLIGGMDYCKHTILRKDCSECGGSALCQHGFRQRSCRQCRLTTSDSSRAWELAHRQHRELCVSARM
ncbi:unnamed protein product [Prorocentrum cordatum]|uniref:MYND-type domain-containing protein n=1 Tax=Prorocentrum cordatum TaxID=2364126 RepID=A0ABN9U5X7_9DINO|nr:unnamed protein product [Polarella glacialis]